MNTTNVSLFVSVREWTQRHLRTIYALSTFVGGIILPAWLLFDTKWHKANVGQIIIAVMMVSLFAFVAVASANAAFKVGEKPAVRIFWLTSYGFTLSALTMWAMFLKLYLAQV